MASYRAEVATPEEDDRVLQSAIRTYEQMLEGVKRLIRRALQAYYETS